MRGWRCCRRDRRCCCCRRRSGGELRADRRRVLADRRHRPECARAVAAQHRRRGDGDTAPFGVATVGRRSAGWRANAATSLTKPYAVLAARSFAAACVARQPGERRADMRVDHGAVGDADHVGLEARRVAAGPARQELRAELRPFAFVLDARSTPARRRRWRTRRTGRSRDARGPAVPAPGRCPRRTAAARSSSRPCRRTG